MNTASDRTVREIQNLFDQAMASWSGRTVDDDLKKEIAATCVKIMNKARVKGLIEMSFQPFKFSARPLSEDQPGNLIFWPEDEYTEGALKEVWFLFNRLDDPNRFEGKA